MARTAQAQAPASDLDEYLTTAELAELLKVPVRTIEDWRYRGEGPPAIKIRGTLRYPKRRVREWLEAKVEAAASAGAR